MKTFIAVCFLLTIAMVVASPAASKGRDIDAELSELADQLLVELRKQQSKPKGKKPPKMMPLSRRGDLAEKELSETDQMKEFEMKGRELEGDLKELTKRFGDDCMNSGEECGVYKFKACCGGYKCSSWNSGTCVVDTDCLGNGEGCWFKRNDCCSGKCQKKNWHTRVCEP